VSRRALLRGIVAVAGVPLALGLAGDWPVRAVAAAEEDDDGADERSEAEAVAAPAVHAAPGAITYTLASRADGPLPVGSTKSKYGAEIGYSAFEGDSYIVHLHAWQRGLAPREEWLSRRIGTSSFRNGAVMVDGRDELNPVGAFAIEMRRQAYKDRRYIRSNWLWIHPASRHVHIQSDGIWNEMEKLAEDPGTSGAVRPPGEWNTLLFLADGSRLEGWVNGQKVVEAEDGRWGSGQISLVGLRRDRPEVRIRFRNLRIWENHLPDPTTVWDGPSPTPAETDGPPAAPHRH
jgi:hypothetical protein